MLLRLLLLLPPGLPSWELAARADVIGRRHQGKKDNKASRGVPQHPGSRRKIEAKILKALKKRSLRERLTTKLIFCVRFSLSTTLGERPFASSSSSVRTRSSLLALRPSVLAPRSSVSSLLGPFSCVRSARRPPFSCCCRVHSMVSTGRGLSPAIATSLAVFSAHVLFTLAHSYAYNNATSHVNAVIDWIAFVVLLVLLADSAAGVNSASEAKDDR